MLKCALGLPCKLAYGLLAVQRQPRPHLDITT